MYQDGASASDIRSSLGNIFKTNKTIYDVLERYSISRREFSDYKEPLNNTFFRRIDTEVKAYILGLMITDGWLLSNREAIGYSSIDIELTKLIHKSLDLGSRAITRITGGPRKICEKNVITQDSYQIQVSDALLYTSLINLGLQPNKTRNEILPSIPESLERHLIRGIFDGDGCVYKLTGVNQPGIIFYSGSKVLLWQISSMLYKHCYISSPKLQPATTIFKISYFTDHEVRELQRFLYEGVTQDLYLIRKKKMFDNIYEDSCNRTNSL